MQQKLIKSNCFLQSIVVFIKHFPNGRIGYDYDSPSGGISFYCDVKSVGRFRFRRKIRRHGNKSGFVFIGYTVIQKL